MSGFVVTCVRGKRAQSIKEMLKMLTMAAHTLSSKAEGEALQNEAANTQTPASLEEEKKKLKQMQFKVLGGQGTGNIIFIRNDTTFAAEDIYRVVAQHTERAKCVRRIVPVSYILTTTIAGLEEKARILKSNIKPDETFKIVLNKRLCEHIDRTHIITVIAKDIPNKVDLNRPQKILIIEILKDLCGIGVIEPRSSGYNITRENE